MDAVNVFLPSSGEAAKHFRTVFAGWTANGLLHPSLWLEANDRDRPVGPALGAELVTGNGIRSVGLLDALATQPFGVVRIVTVHLVAPQADPATVTFAEDVAGLVSDALAHGQRCERLNVVAPATDVAAVPCALVQSPHQKHFLVSSEERLTDRHAASGVLGEESLARHAALAVATLTGCWRRMQAAPFDDEHFSMSLEAPHVAAVRSFGRVLVAGPLPEQVGGELFRRRRTEAWTASAAQAVLAPDPDRVSADVARQLAAYDDGILTYRPTDPLPAPARRHVGIRQALGMMVRFILGKLQAAPGQFAGRVSERARRGVEGLAQHLTFGGDSRMVVSFGGTARAGVHAGDRQAAVGYASQLLQDLGRSVSPPATGRLWDALRRVSFGLLDGGPFPDGVTAPTDGAHRQVLNDVSDVVPAPEAGHFHLDAVLHTADAGGGSAGDGSAGDGSALPGSGAGLPAWAFAPVSPRDPRTAQLLRDLLGDRRELAARGRPGEEPGEAAAPGGEALPAVEPDESFAARLDTAIGELDAWTARHERSLLWRVGVGLSREVEEAGAAFREALRTVRRRESQEDDSAKARARRWLRRMWIGGLLVAVTVAGGGAVARNLGRQRAEWVGVLVAAVLVWLVWWFVSFLRYQRRVFQIQYEIDRRHRDHLDAIATAEHSATELLRLDSLYRQYRDWADIVAWLVHRPEGSCGEPEPGGEEHALDLPRGLGVAVGSPSESVLRRASSLAGRQVFGRGWLTNLYARYVREAMSDLKHQLGMSPDTRDPDPDHDIAEPSPRAFLRGQLATGQRAATWRAEVLEQVERELWKLPPEELFSDIQPHGEALDEAVDWGDGTGPDPDAFLREIAPVDDPEWQDSLRKSLWTAHARMNQAERVERIFLWGPEGMQPPSAAPPVTWLPLQAGGAGGGAFGVQMFRLDVARPVPFTDLAVFEPVAEHGMTVPAPEHGDVW